VIGVIVRTELRMLLRDRALLGIACVVLALSGWIAFEGHSRCASKIRVEAEARTQFESRLSEIAAGAAEARTALEQGQRPLTPPAWGERHAAFVGKFRAKETTVMPAAPLGALASGASDMSSGVFEVGIDASDLTQERAQLEHPISLAIGRFDLAFLLIVLLPLLVIVLSHAALAGERASRRADLLLAQPIDATKLLFGKALASVIVLTALLLVVFVIVGSTAAWSTPTFSSEGGSLRLVVWFAVSLAYALFWLGLSLMVGRSAPTPSSSAMILGGIYVACVIVVPATASLTAQAFFPPPSRVEHIVASRQATQEAEKKKADALARFYHDHPELAEGKDGLDETENWVRETEAQARSIEETLAPVEQRFAAALDGQRRVSLVFAWLSPAIAFRAVVDDLAGVGPARRSLYLEAVADLLERRREFFVPAMLARQPIDDLSRVPRFEFAGEAAGTALRRSSDLILWLVALAVIAFAIALRPLPAARFLDPRPAAS
jgi:ABC-2 type transport system permease protein